MRKGNEYTLMILIMCFSVVIMMASECRAQETPEKAVPFNEAVPQASLMQGEEGQKSDDGQMVRGEKMTVFQLINIFFIWFDIIKDFLLKLL